MPPNLFTSVVTADGLVATDTLPPPISISLLSSSTLPAIISSYHTTLTSSLVAIVLSPTPALVSATQIPQSLVTAAFSFHTQESAVALNADSNASIGGQFISIQDDDTISRLESISGNRIFPIIKPSNETDGLRLSEHIEDAGNVQDDGGDSGQDVLVPNPEPTLSATSLLIPPPVLTRASQTIGSFTRIPIDPSAYKEFRHMSTAEAAFPTNASLAPDDGSHIEVDPDMEVGETMPISQPLATLPMATLTLSSVMSAGASSLRSVSTTISPSEITTGGSVTASITGTPVDTFITSRVQTLSTKMTATSSPTIVPGMAPATGQVDWTNPTRASIMNGGDEEGISKAAIAGSVVGGVLLLGVISILLWLWRKRVTRPSSTLTPLTPFGGDPKLGIREKQASGAMLSSGLYRVRTWFGMRNSSHPGGNLNRGNSQFLDVAIPMPRGVNPTRSPIQSMQRHRGTGPLQPMTQNSSGVNPNTGSLFDIYSPPQVERDGSLRRRESRHAYNNSSGDIEGFLPVTIDGYKSSSPLPSQVNTTNPFLDPPTSSISKTLTYVNDLDRIGLQRSTDESTSTSVVGRSSGAGGHAGATAASPRGRSTRQSETASSFRGSYNSYDSYNDNSSRDDKFRSDPFDLEQPSLLARRGAPTVKNLLGPRYNIGVELPVAGASTASVVGQPGVPYSQNDMFMSRHNTGQGYSTWVDTGPGAGRSAMARVDGRPAGGGGNVGSKDGGVGNFVGAAF